MINLKIKGNTAERFHVSGDAKTLYAQTASIVSSIYTTLILDGRSDEAKKFEKMMAETDWKSHFEQTKSINKKFFGLLNEDEEKDKLIASLETLIKKL